MRAACGWLPPKCLALRLPDARWRVANCHRLALTLTPWGTACCIQRADSPPGEMPIDAWGDHILVCKGGPARLRPQRALHRKLGHLLSMAGPR